MWEKNNNNMMKKEEKGKNKMVAPRNWVNCFPMPARLLAGFPIIVDFSRQVMAS